ncbi:alpha/beta hydrolase family protein [Aurantivibrio plasticivorans]
MRLCSLILIVLTLFPPFAIAVDIDALFSRSEITSVKISPDGEHFAMRVFREGKHGLMFVERESFKPKGWGLLPGDEEIGDFFWVNNERVVVRLEQFKKGEAAPRFYGELYAINLDGRKGELIYGYRAGRQQLGTAIRQKEREYAWGEIIDILPDDPRKILISSTPMSGSHDNRSNAQYLDVYRGTDKSAGKRSEFPSATFYTDQSHEMRIVKSLREDRTAHVEVKPKQGDWLTLESGSYGTDFWPLAASSTGEHYFISDNFDSDKVGLFQLSFDSQEYSKLYSHDTVDVHGFIFSQDRDSVVGMLVYDGYPKYLMLSKEEETAKVFRSMLASFPGQVVNIVSSSSDDKYWVVFVSSDTNPGSFYLFDREINKLKLLFNSMPTIERDQLAPMEPIKFESFDGVSVHGYFTAAHGDADMSAPLIVLVHGGPRARDYWGFDPEVQALALSGYSVLQVNYRGSSGYGEKFLHAGDLQWGNAVQKDIIAGTKWALENKKILKNRVCIMGGSFGAYSAMQSATLDPDGYKCVVANAGIYDLELMFEEGDIPDVYWGENYLQEVIGDDVDALKSISPVNYADKIKAKVFIAHGKKDERAPFEHYKRMTKALKKSDVQYESFIKKESGHGFYSNENRIAYMNNVLKFLEKNL